MQPQRHHSLLLSFSISSLNKNKTTNNKKNKIKEICLYIAIKRFKLNIEQKKFIQQIILKRIHKKAQEQQQQPQKVRVCKMKIVQKYKIQK